MKASELTNLIQIRQNPEFDSIFDVELNHLNALREYDSVEVHLVLYPFSRQVLAENYRFTPFQDYANDISTRRRSLYSPMPRPANSLFGIFLGILIILVFWFIKPAEIASLQSFVAILGAYFIGKDLWQDIESLLVNVSKNWRLRYQTGYYAYQVEKNTTLTNYSALARVKRYGRATIVPGQMEFITNANSKTVRLRFSRSELSAHAGDSAHILGIRLDPAIADDFIQAGYMLSVKLAFNERALLLRRAHEYFQSLNEGQIGCLNFGNEWTPDAALARQALYCGNLRYLESQRIVPAVGLVSNSAST